MVFKGAYTAIITPFKKNGQLDREGLAALTDFQVENDIEGIVATGTTGESPTLTWSEHINVIKNTYTRAGSRVFVIAGTGSNSTEEALEGTKKSHDIGVRAVLLVDPYYNGPSSLEIRKEYVEPIAGTFPDVQIIPYIIPGRTGTQIHPQDLAKLSNEYPNVKTVKEATGNLENVKQIRKLCGEGFSILSGDDDRTLLLMTDPEVRADGVISVTSNVAPAAVRKMVKALANGRGQEGEALAGGLKPLFDLVTVKTVEETRYGPVEVKARNPLPYKTLMQILGMPSGPCRRPLGRMTRKGLEVVLSKARDVYEKSPEILEPIATFFDIDVHERLFQEKRWHGLTYDGY